MSSSNDIQISVLTKYSAADATQIGHLMPQLADVFDDQPISEDRLKEIIDSPHHDQLVARDKSGQIVGAATLSVTIGAGSGSAGYLNDFVVSADVRGQGVGQKLWDAIVDWCRDKNISLNFTSRPERTAAHNLYLKNGAKIRQTAAFHKKIKD